MAKTETYQQGYSAAKRSSKAEITELKRQLAQRQTLERETRTERVYFNCLALALEHCGRWSIGDEKLHDAEGFCKLAKIFADNSISKL